jgi:hypothetical protein
MTGFQLDVKVHKFRETRCQIPFGSSHKVGPISEALSQGGRLSLTLTDSVVWRAEMVFDQ